ncbi:UNVERIFIED_CONTAM: CPBP family intramembrane metalloprotease [Streptococcus canis]|uniref:CPBP family intramembrane metalloprotease n=1 Tax=Streptococcus canis TaxID=1329 RepID=A0AAE4TQ80_STRCB|nr:type II CAAX endopeptidase family protein [Streptococcus canis]MDV5977730.1 CPBP family intramembrane metalloprotease [Streptococcus canis]
MKMFINCLKIAALIILVLIFNALPMILLQKQHDIPMGLNWGIGIFYLVIVGSVIIVLWRLYQAKQDVSIKQQKMRLIDWGYLALFWLVGRVIAIVGTLVNQLWSGQAVSTNDAAIHTLARFIKGGFPLYTALFVLVIALIAPIMEELVFRGFPTTYLFKGKSLKVAGLLTSLLFALPHATNLVEFIMYTCMGLLLFVAYQRRGNLKDSILLHIFNNLLPAIILLLTGLGIL